MVTQPNETILYIFKKNPKNHILKSWLGNFYYGWEKAKFLVGIAMKFSQSKRWTVTKAHWELLKYCTWKWKKHKEKNTPQTTVSTSYSTCIKGLKHSIFQGHLGCEGGFGASGQPPAGFLAMLWTLCVSTFSEFLALTAASWVMFFHGLTGNARAGVDLTKLILFDHLYFLWIFFPPL